MFVSLQRPSLAQGWGRGSCMSLRQWLIKEYAIDLHVDDAVGGAALADALAHALERADLPLDEQRELLLAVPAHTGSLDLCEACMLRAERIEALQARRREALLRWQAQCQNGVAKKRSREPAADVALYRFRPLWDETDESADIVDDMLRRMAAEGCLLLADGSLRDLRQGLGYCRRGEDPHRLRRPVRWLRGENVLHEWVQLLTERDDALCGVVDSSKGKWITAASLLCHANGTAYKNTQIHHGEVKPEVRRWLDSLVPHAPKIHV